jgi:hypothetical protein
MEKIGCTLNTSELEWSDDDRAPNFINRLKLLQETTSFDFDVASDIHPELLGSEEIGESRTKSWERIFKELSKCPKLTAFVRWNTGLPDGCYTFANSERPQAIDLWVRIFEDMRAEDIMFTRDGDNATTSKVAANRSSILLSVDQDSNCTISGLGQPAILYGYDGPDVLSTGGEDCATNESILFAETYDSLIKQISRYKTSGAVDTHHAIACLRLGTHFKKKCINICV